MRRGFVIACVLHGSTHDALAQQATITHAAYAASEFASIREFDTAGAFGARVLSWARPASSFPTALAPTERPAIKTWRRTLIGALAGGGLLGGAAAIHASRCDDCFFEGPFVVVSTTVGAALGAFIGYVSADHAAKASRRVKDFREGLR